MWQGGESRAWRAGPELARGLVCGAEVVEDRGKVACDIQMMLIRRDHLKGLWTRPEIYVHDYNS